MPYRRLPNTDQARLRALRQALQKASEAEYNEQVLNYRTVNEAQRFLMQFDMQVTQYRDNFENKVTANKKYRHIVQNARMYISHFIQVLNLSVIRGEIKREQKELYKLDPETNIVPDLTTDEDLLTWGQNIIDGEQERTSMGGFPIYNPAINKVKVHFDIFREHHVSHNLRKQNTSRVQDNLEELRKQADELILNIWNQVEDHYKNMLPYAKLQHCKAYGLVYYYRTGEKHLTAETDKELKRKEEMQPTLQWIE